jgi:hypothetical protein
LVLFFVGCIQPLDGWIWFMRATEVIAEIKRLPEREAAAVYDFLFSADTELDRLLAAIDRLPRQHSLTEDEILALPRARAAR